jgi:hypothetical protein
MLRKGLELGEKTCVSSTSGWLELAQWWKRSVTKPATPFALLKFAITSDRFDQP